MRVIYSLVMLPGLLIGLTAHEFAHAWSASLLGDDYPRRQGRVSLNPFRHLALLGTLAIFVLPFGWAKPVQVNLYNFKRPKRDYLLTSLAGPAANLLIVGACILLMQFTRHCYRYGPLAQPSMMLAHSSLLLLAIINTILAVVNLLPIPPLDGSKIWPCLIPRLRPSFGKRTTLVFVVLLVILVSTGSLSPLVVSALGIVTDWMPASDQAVFEDLRDRGIQAHEAGRYVEAARHFTEALAVNPRSHDCLVRRAAARYEVEDLAGALRDLDEAIQRHQLAPDYYEDRAAVLEALGRDADAQVDRLRAEALRGIGRPSSAPASAPGPIAPAGRDGPG